MSGYVVRDPARRPSSWRSQRSLDDALRDQGVVGISGIDTRALTRHLRERGAMRVGISSTETSSEALLERVRGSAEMSGANLSAEVSTSEPYVVPAAGEKRFTVAALDLGIKANTPRMMSERGIETHVLPATASLDDVLAVQPDGLFFSNGPGDPAATTGQVELLRAALERGIPYFGICFGNQLFGRALGLRHLQADLRPPRHQPAGDGPHDRQGRGDRAQPRVRRRRAAGCADRDAVRRRHRLARLPQRRRGRGPRAAGARRGAEVVLGPVPPGGGRRPARRGVPVRPVRRPDGRDASDAEARRTSRASWSSGPARS